VTKYALRLATAYATWSSAMYVTSVKMSKQDKLVMGNRPQNYRVYYRVSLAIWDHNVTCYPTQANTPCLNRSR